MRAAVRRFFYGILILIVSLPATGLGAVVGIWIFDRELPTEVIDRRIEHSSYHPGEEVCYMTEFIRLKQCNTYIERFLVDSRHELRPVSATEMPVPTSDIGRTTVRRFCFKLDSDIPAGWTTLNFSSVHRCNPVHYLVPIYDELREYPFQVAGAEGE